MLAISCSEFEYQWIRKNERYTDEKWVAIRIFSHPSYMKQMSKQHDAQFDDILVLYFTDISKTVEQDGILYRPFNASDYQQVLDFIEEHKDADKVFVHCTLGVCRSAGIVHGLAHKYDWIRHQHGLRGDADVYPYPNVISWFMANV